MKKCNAIQNRILNILPLAPFDALVIDGNMWFSANGFNGLCRCDLETGETELVGTFLDEEKDRIFLHSQMRCYEKKIIFVPNRARGIDIYDIENNQFSRIPLPKECIEKCWDQRATKTYALQQFGHIFVIFGLFLPSIIFIDMLTNKIDYICDIYENLCGSFYNKSLLSFRKTSCSVGENAYALCAQSRQIIEVNIRNKTYTLHSTENRQFETICYDGDCFWLSSHNEIYTMQNFQYRKVVTLDEIYTFYYSVCTGNYIYFITQEYEEIIGINKRDLTVVKLVAKCDEDVIRIDDGTNRTYSGICVYGIEEAVIICDKSNLIYFIKDGRIQRKLHLILKNNIELIEQAKSLLLQWRGFSDFLCESRFKLWLSYLVVRDSNLTEKEYQHNNIGNKIYRELSKNGKC